MSNINTNGLDANYPIPGQNNSTQGFRNNFAIIKNNLNTGSNEITDLQTKAVLKSALANSTIDNNMANTLIANASVLQFRSTMYNLGNALVDNVLVDCSLGDSQYGNLAGNITLSFGSWVPTNTSGGIELQIGRPNVDANFNVTFPSEAIFDSTYGWSLVENSSQNGSLTTLTFPHNSTQLNFKLISTDCGNSIYVTPVNRGFKTTQIQTRTPPSTGQLGDVNGTVCIDAAVTQLKVTSSTSSDFFATANTTTLYTGMPVVFTGTSFEANVVVGNTYYVGNIANSTHFTVSANANASGNVNLAGSTGTMYLNPVSYMYIATADYSANAYNRNIDSITAPNIITVSGSTANLSANNPIIFAGDDTGNTGNITLNKVYYISSVSSSNITISTTRTNGVAGAEVKTLTTVSTGNVDIDYTVYDGPDIFRRIPLNPF